MTKKGSPRTPTICEWALGVTVEDYLDQREQRRRLRNGKTSSPRLKVEVSTDDETEEDSLKITYPRSDSRDSSVNDDSSTVSSIKKVRFEKLPPKSAIKKKPNSGTETESEPQKSSDSSKSSDSQKKNKKKKNSRSETDTSTADTSSGDCDSESYSDSCCCQPVRRKRELRGAGRGKKENSKSNNVETESSDSDVDKPKKKVNTKSRKKSKRVVEIEEDSDDEASSSSDDDAPKKKKGKKRTNNKSKRQDEDEEKSDIKDKEPESKDSGQETVDSNVGPTKKKKKKEKGDTKSPNKDSEKQKKKPAELKDLPSYGSYPEANLSPHIRRPNLIMPITAQVLQVEHAIEDVEDPRPNAFHDSQHGVLRVYHGPAYGNPTGMLYPRRDLSSSSRPLPLGTPHPMNNPYFHGFAQSANPGDLQVQDQSPWSGCIPGTSMPNGPPPMMATSGSPQNYAPWAQDTVAGREHKASPPRGPPEMSGALNGHASAQEFGGKDQDSPTNVAPQMPINVSMYSYGGQGGISDPFSEEARKQYREAMDRAKRENGSNRGSNRGSEKRKAVHRDLQWDLPDERTPVNSSWAKAEDDQGWFAHGDGNNDWSNNNQNYCNDQQNNTWGSNNGNNDWDQSKGNGANGGDHPWPVFQDMGSNSSGGSKKSQQSHRGNNGPTGDNLNWGPDGNNVGGGSDGSNQSHGSKNGANSTGYTSLDNNAVPIHPTNTNGNEAWGTSTGDWNNMNSWGHNGNENGASDPSNNMPGAWGVDTGNGSGGAENAHFWQTQPSDTGGFSWGDQSAAQGPEKETETTW